MIDPRALKPGDVFVTEGSRWATIHAVRNVRIVRSVNHPTGNIPRAAIRSECGASFSSTRIELPDTSRHKVCQVCTRRLEAKAMKGAASAGRAS